MNEVRTILAQARRRFALIDWFAGAAVGLAVGLLALFIARAVERVFGLTSTISPWYAKSWWIIAALTVVFGITWAIIKRRSEMNIARELDERANLAETLSTAIAVEKTAPSDPWAAAMLDTARDAAKRVPVAAAVPMVLPRYWYMPLATALLLLLGWWTIPAADILGKQKEELAKKKEEARVQEVKAVITANQAKLEQMLQKAKLDVKAGEGENPEGRDGKKTDIQDPEALKRSEIRKLTDLADKIEGMKDGEKSKQLDALKENMRQLKQPGPGPLDNFSRSLARGEFKEAKEQLDQLTKEFGDGKLSEEQKEQAKKQAENLAKQLEELGKAQEQVAKKLENQGLDKKTAEQLAKAASSSPEDLKKALEAMKGMSPEQQQQLLDMAKAAMKASESAQQMGEAAKEMAKSMGQEGMSQQAQEAMDKMSEQLSQGEMMQEDMSSLDAALKEAKDQLSQMGKELDGDQSGSKSGKGDKGEGEGEGEGEGKGKGKGQGEGDGEGDPNKLGDWAEGDSKGKGKGSGGPGQSQGGRSPEAQAADFKIDKKKANSKTGNGPIIGSRLVYGEQVKGESKAEFENAVAAAAEGASEAIENQQVPREMQDAVKHYFGKLQEKVKKEQGTTTPPAAPATTPAAQPAPAPATPATPEKK